MHPTGMHTCTNKILHRVGTFLRKWLQLLLLLEWVFHDWNVIVIILMIPYALLVSDEHLFGIHSQRKDLIYSIFITHVNSVGRYLENSCKISSVVSGDTYFCTLRRRLGCISNSLQDTDNTAHTTHPPMLTHAHNKAVLLRPTPVVLYE